MCSLQEDNENLEVSEKYKHAGVILDKSGKFRKEEENKLAQGTKVLNVMVALI